MKKIIFLILFGFMSCVIIAQKNDSLKVFQGTYVRSFLLSNIDNIVHDSEGQFVRFYYHDKMTNAFLINNIDSIVIERATDLCYKIPKENLNGWDDGVYYLDKMDDKNSFYIVSHSDPEDGTRTVYLSNFSNDDITQSMALVFSPDEEIHDIFIEGYQFEAFPKEGLVTFVAYDKDGNAIDSFDVPYEDDSDITSVKQKSRRKAIEHYRIVQIRKFLAFAGKTLWNTAYYGVKLEDGLYADILKDFLLGRLVGLYAKSFLWEVSLAQAIDTYLKQLYENNKNWFMGSAGIEITSINRVSKSTIFVEGEISNISTIPSTRLVASEYPNYIDDKLVYLKEVPNYVLYGIAEGNSGQPGLYLNDACTTPVVVSGSHFSCTLPVEYKPGKKFYFRPFLMPSSQFEESADWGQTLGKMVSSNIRYGKRKEYTDQAPTCSTGEVVSKTDKSAVVKCSYNGAEGFECGVVVSGNSGTKKFTTSSEDGERPIVLSGLIPSTTYNYWAYVDVDGIPTNGEIKSFTTEGLVPIATTGGYYDVTENSAVVECSFENVPEGGKCYVYIHWIDDWGSPIANSLSASKGKNQKISLSPLSPATTYYYTAIISYDGNEYKGEEKYFTTKGRNLCPDENHPHAIDLGLPSGTNWCCCNLGASTPEDCGGYYTWNEAQQLEGNWSVPSQEQMLELFTDPYCFSWRNFEKINGVMGYHMISWNGNELFIPAAGFEGYMMYGNDDYVWGIYHVGEEGNYWTSTFYPYTSDYGEWAYYWYFSYWRNEYYNEHISTSNSVRPVSP